ncbi:MAG: hypothetical protein P1V20_19485 [Verrucomicrobiales bacterium]|nr:hypothetical protein [Verrucomicrobiales bacterium]
MKTKLIIAALAALTALPFVAVAETPPPVRYLTDSAVSASQSLFEKVSGTVWIYDYGKGKMEFGFSPDGNITLVDEWDGTTWRVISPNEIVLHSKGDRLALLSFNKDLTTFKSKGWSGKPSTGKATGKTLESEG